MPIKITDNAANRFGELRKTINGNPRIEIKAGGCNGFEKTFSWTVDLANDDIVVETEIELTTVGTAKLRPAVLQAVITNGSITSIIVVDTGFGYIECLQRFANKFQSFITTYGMIFQLHTITDLTMSHVTC